MDRQTGREPEVGVEARDLEAAAGPGPETTKHSPRVDDAMARDVESLLKGAPVESRSDEGRLQEDPAVGPGRRRADEDAPGLGVSEVAARRRADLARHLAAATFPAGRHALVAAAESDHAPADVVDRLRSLPAGDRYANVQAVWQALGGEVEDRHTG